MAGDAIHPGARSLRAPVFDVAELRHRFVSTLSNRQGRSIAANPDLREITWKLVYFMETGPCCERFFICALKYVSRSLYFFSFSFFFFFSFSRIEIWKKESWFFFWLLEKKIFVSFERDFSYFCCALISLYAIKEKFKSFWSQEIWKKKSFYMIQKILFFWNIYIYTYICIFLWIKYILIWLGFGWILFAGNSSYLAWFESIVDHCKNKISKKKRRMHD